MLLGAIVTVIDIIISIINYKKIHINFKNNHVKNIVCFFVVWSIYAVVAIYKTMDMKAYLMPRQPKKYGILRKKSSLKGKNYRHAVSS